MSESASSTTADQAETSGTSAPAHSLASYQDVRTIQRILHTARTIAIVGLSPNELRPSNYVGFYLQRHGYRIVPVNPRAEEILGEKSYPSLLDIPFPVDVVDVFRTPDVVVPIAEEAIKIGAKALWLQFDVINFKAAEIARQAGLDVVMDRCMKIEHARHRGRMHWYGLNTGVLDSSRREDE